MENLRGIGADPSGIRMIVGLAGQTTTRTAVRIGGSYRGAIDIGPLILSYAFVPPMSVAAAEEAFGRHATPSNSAASDMAGCIQHRGPFPVIGH